MTNAEALILLVRTLSKNEKRSFRLGKKSTADYIVLFDLIDKDELITVDGLKEAFENKGKGAVFNVTVTYLYKLLLDKLLALRQNQDSDYSLMTQILKAKILFEKSIFPAALEILEKVKHDAAALEKNEALIMASRLELDYLHYLNMPDISEEDLINRHYSLNVVRAVDAPYHLQGFRAHIESENIAQRPCLHRAESREESLYEFRGAETSSSVSVGIPDGGR